MKSRRSLGLLGIALVAMAFIVATAGAQTVVRPGFNIFSVDQDVEIGRQSVLQLEKKLPVMNEATAQRYVASLGARLAAQAPGP